MVFITIDLIRKRAEHNEGEIGTLEEIALHQENIEKIEYLGQSCRHLKIILLQNNIISKIENLNKLKELEYLNLAINNIEYIENLEGCESLNKLDLTVNFIGDLTSINNLRNNLFLKDLYLTGNPCTDYEGYRQYVVATLPQLESLDSKHITRSERIVALQEYEKNILKIEKQQKVYALKREQQKERLKLWVEENEHIDKDDTETLQNFWNSKSEYAPETRTVCAKHKKKDGPVFGGTDPPKEPKPPTVFFAPDGRPYNMNQGKLPFNFSSDDPEEFTLDLAIYKYLDTELLKVDIEPTYVRVKIKEKYFQLALPAEIQTDKSTTIRSKANGHLIITMPILNPNPQRVEMKRRKEAEVLKQKQHQKEEEDQKNVNQKITKREYLEIGPTKNLMDFSRIVPDQYRRNSTFVDNPEVPPLE